LHALYLVSVWVHILAATAWVGGIFFLVLVVVPWLRRGKTADPGRFLLETGERFRTVGWVCFAIVLVTGTFNLWMRGIRLGDFARAEWLASPFGKAVLLKLGAFAVVLVVSAVHDFSLGPRATLAIRHDPQSAEAAVLRRKASLLGRANGLLALLLVAAGVIIVRGWPW
jgi:putative copper export protein